MSSTTSTKAPAPGGACRTGTDCGCGVSAPITDRTSVQALAGFSSGLRVAFSIVVTTVVTLAITAEWLGVLDRLSAFVPWPVWLAFVVGGGYPIFRTVLRAKWRRKVTSHTLMTVGLVAAMLAGVWPAAVLIVFFMPRKPTSIAPSWSGRTSQH